MQLGFITPTQLKRHASAVYAANELVKAEYGEHNTFITDTLLNAYYGIYKIAEDLEAVIQEDQIKQRHNR